MENQCFGYKLFNILKIYFPILKLCVSLTNNICVKIPYYTRTLALTAMRTVFVRRVTKTIKKKFQLTFSMLASD